MSNENMNNEFENGNIENKTENENENENVNANANANANVSGVPISGNVHEAAETEAQPTYSRTYTPSDGGYTGQTTRNAGVGGSYQSYGQHNYGYTPKKKPSKAPFVAIGVIGFLLFSVACMCFGFLVGKAGRIADTDANRAGISENVGGYTEISAPESETTPAIKAPGSDAATIKKNDGTETTVNADYKIGEPMTKSEAAAAVKDSVVEITTEQVVTGSYFNQYVKSGAGSGVIIAEEGYIITNNHVIKGASSIKVRLTNGNEYPAELVGTDANTDIAVIKIDAGDEKLTVATLGSSAKLAVAEDVLVIGNPLGTLGGSVTSGIISALAREITVDGESMTLIQTSAAVNPGNSGGGMFNLSGELVGIVNAKSVGTDVEGLGFAIPIDTAYDIVLQLMDYGYVKGRIDHGLELIDINDIFTAASYHVSAYGVYVYESKYTDEIKNGDRITSINGKEVTSSADVKTALADCKVGDTVEVTVARNGKLVNAKLTLHEYVPQNDGDVSFG